jgi:hypothetical protein
MRTVFQLLFGHQAKTGPVYISGALLFFSTLLSRKGENYAWSFRWQRSTNSLTRQMSVSRSFMVANQRVVLLAGTNQFRPSQEELQNRDETSPIQVGFECCNSIANIHHAAALHKGSAFSMQHASFNSIQRIKHKNAASWEARRRPAGLFVRVVPSQVRIGDAIYNGMGESFRNGILPRRAPRASLHGMRPPFLNSSCATSSRCDRVGVGRFSV